jgi:hypothetical protein
MNRKELLLKSIGLGTAGTGAFAIIGAPCCAQQTQPAQGMPCDKKYDFSQIWVYGGDETIRREGEVTHFQHIRNPAGLKVADGCFLCPVVESLKRGGKACRFRIQRLPKKA